MKLNKPSCNICKALQKAIEAYIAKADNDLENSMDDAGYVDSKDSVNAASDLEEEVTEILTEQTEELADVIEEAGTIPKAKKAVEEYFEDDVTGEILSATFRDYFSETILSLSDSYMKEVEGDMAVTQLRARTTAWVNQWSNELANLMQLTSADKMKSLLQEALDSDKGAVVFARSLIDEGIRQEAYRARTVAVTEMLRAHSVAQQEAIMQSPATDRKKWRHSGAHKNEPRPNHVAMDGQIVPKADPFILTGRDGGTYYPMYPRDTELPPFESINCHCIHVPVTNDDVLGMSYEERKKMQEDFIAADDGEWKKELDAQNRIRSIGSTENEEDRRGGNKSYDVNIEYIQSKEYGEKFKNFNESNDVQRKMRASATRMLRRRSGSEYEELTYIDSNTGKCRSQRNATKPREVEPTSAMKKMCKDADEYTIISIHNHPGSTTPSLNDVITCKARKYKYGLVVCHDGTIYKYSVRGDLNEVIVDGGLDYLERMKYTNNQEDKTKMKNRAIEILLDGGVEMEVY